MIVGLFPTSPGNALNASVLKSLLSTNDNDTGMSLPVAVAGAPAAAAEAPAGGDAKKEEKKSEPPSEKQEEQAMEGLSSLFG